MSIRQICVAGILRAAQSETCVGGFWRTVGTSINKTLFLPVKPPGRTPACSWPLHLRRLLLDVLVQRSSRSQDTSKNFAPKAVLAFTFRSCSFSFSSVNEITRLPRILAPSRCSRFLFLFLQATFRGPRNSGLLAMPICLEPQRPHCRCTMPRPLSRSPLAQHRRCCNLLTLRKDAQRLRYPRPIIAAPVGSGS